MLETVRAAAFIPLRGYHAPLVTREIAAALKEIEMRTTR